MSLNEDRRRLVLQSLLFWPHTQLSFLFIFFLFSLLIPLTVQDVSIFAFSRFPIYIFLFPFTIWWFISWFTDFASVGVCERLREKKHVSEKKLRNYMYLCFKWNKTLGYTIKLKYIIHRTIWFRFIFPFIIVFFPFFLLPCKERPGLGGYGGRSGNNGSDYVASDWVVWAFSGDAFHLPFLPPSLPSSTSPLSGQHHKANPT